MSKKPTNEANAIFPLVAMMLENVRGFNLALVRGEYELALKLMKQCVNLMNFEHRDKVLLGKIQHHLNILSSNRSASANDIHCQKYARHYDNYGAAVVDSLWLNGYLTMEMLRGFYDPSRAGGDKI